MYKTLIAVIAFCLGVQPLHAQPNELMPIPKFFAIGEQRFQIDKGFHVVMKDTASSRAGKAVMRFLKRLDNRTQLILKKEFFRNPL